MSIYGSVLKSSLSISLYETQNLHLEWRFWWNCFAFDKLILLQVSKNDDEERCFLKWFGFRISLYLMEFQIRAFLSFLFGSLLLTFEPNIFRVGGLDSNDIIKLYAQTFYSNTSYQLCELCTLCLLECYNWTVKPCKTLQAASIWASKQRFM